MKPLSRYFIQYSLEGKTGAAFWALSKIWQDNAQPEKDIARALYSQSTGGWTAVAREMLRREGIEL